jgi:exopolysaccharide biosynthesis WecB/TagA/CpsF family protein
LLWAGAAADSQPLTALAVDVVRRRSTVSAAMKRSVRPGLWPLSAVVNRLKTIDNEAEEAALIERITAADCPLVLSFVNQNSFNLAFGSPEFAARLLDSDILLRDGVGMELCLAALRKAVGRNMNGTDFIPRLAVAFAGRRTALFGTAEPWTSKAAAALEKMGCRLVSSMDGFRPEMDYVEEIARTAPELIILAMGSPRQEIVAARVAAAATSPVLIVNGGAIADFLAERFERAPTWMRHLRCEWLFRLTLEPKRLWRRYLLGGIPFAWHVLQLRHALHETAVSMPARRLVDSGQEVGSG